MKTQDIRRFLTGQLLIAMPQMPDPRFARTVIYVCAHTADGAMGLVINRLLGGLSFDEMLDQLNIERTVSLGDTAVHYGGPVEAGRGFVLHTADYTREGTLAVEEDVGLTATVDVLRAIAEGRGPRRFLLALGYAGWGAGQLDEEMQANGWLHAPADEALLFDTDLETKWQRAIAKIGGSLSMLSGEAGHA